MIFNDKVDSVEIVFEETDDPNKVKLARSLFEASKHLMKVIEVIKNV